MNNLRTARLERIKKYGIRLWAIPKDEMDDVTWLIKELEAAHIAINNYCEKECGAKIGGMACVDCQFNPAKIHYIK